MFFRRRRLKKEARKEATAFLPLSAIKAMAVVLDCADNELDGCLEAIRKFCKVNQIELTVLYVDFEEKGNTERENTIYRRDLNLFGYPSTRKAGTFLGKWFDCFICLSDSSRFCMEYLSKAVDARFKIGVKPVYDDPYDIIVVPSENGTQGKSSQKDFFLTVKDIIEKIR